MCSRTSHESIHWTKRVSNGRIETIPPLLQPWQSKFKSINRVFIKQLPVVGEQFQLAVHPEMLLLPISW